MHVWSTTRRFVRRQQNWGIVVVTYLLALVAWAALVARWLPMPGTRDGMTAAGTHGEMSMTDPGVPEALALSNGLAGLALYLLVWGTMMVAMMYPSSVPAFRAFYRTLHDEPTLAKVTETGVVMMTFALVWALTGVVSLVVNLAFPVVSVGNGGSVLLLGGTLLLLSAYQLSPYKCRYLRHCRTPERAVEGHRPGLVGAVRSGWRLSVASVGCCWALMALMVVVGSMNVLWMAVITVVVSAELLASNGERLAEVTGGVSGVAGLVVLTTGLV
ncbi:DUF2182 domain-containing protein [Haladaptatus sp. NG-WS-4]